MRRIVSCIALAAWVLSTYALAQGPIPGEQKFDTRADDEKTLKAVGLSVDGPALLDYFRKRTFKEANPKEMDRLIVQLGDNDFAIREKAYAGLIILGPSALVGLKQAEANADVEVKQRARDLRDRLEAKAEPPIQAATARLVALTRPAGAAEVLLGFVPFAPDQGVTDEICKALGSVAVAGGKIDLAVQQALGDKLPIKRGAAAEAFVRADVAKLLPEPDKILPGVRALLRDPEPTVRLRTGLALVSRKEKEALPVLIELLNHLPPEQMWPVEEILIRLAGDKVPAVSLGTTEETRKACFTAWTKWLGEHPMLTLAKLEEIPPMLGRTVIVQQKIRNVVGGRVTGEVMELDNQKKPIWKFDVANYPVDAHVWETDKGETQVLVAEFQASQVSIRDTKGNVIKDFKVGGNPIGAQRLADGNIFVVLQNRLVEYDMKGAEKFSYNRPNHDIFRAKKLPNGEIALITSAGQYTRIAAATQQVQKSFQVAPVPVLFGSMDVLPNGNVLVPDFQQNRVVEYNGDGKQIGQINVQWPNSALRLPNGNTLIASQNTRKVIEFNRGGTRIWEYDSDGMVFNARRR